MWNFDLTNIPRGRYETRTRVVKDAEQSYQVFIPERIWAATAGGEVVLTQFIPENKHHPKGRWDNMHSEREPIAWQPFVKPVHPHAEIETSEAA